MTERIEAPYGAWASPITAETVISAAVGLPEVQADGDDVWWNEGRPEEGGRVQIVRRPGRRRRRAARRLRGPHPGARVRRRRLAVHDGVLFFANWSDQRLYRLDAGSTRAGGHHAGARGALGDRYADIDVAPDGVWLVCVREDHRADGGEAVNEIVPHRHRPSASRARCW